MTLAQDVLAIAADLFTDPYIAPGIIKRAVIRYTELGEYKAGSAEVAHVDLPCLALLDREEDRLQTDLQVLSDRDPKVEVWLLQGVPRGQRSDGVFVELDPEVLAQEQQFTPGEGQLFLVEAPGATEPFVWTGGVTLQGDLKAVLSASDLTVGIGALWQVTVKPA